MKIKVYFQTLIRQAKLKIMEKKFLNSSGILKTKTKPYKQPDTDLKKLALKI